MRYRIGYYDHLTVARKKNDISVWLRFFLIGVQDTAERSIGVFEAILELKERIETEIIPQIHVRRQLNAQMMLQSFSLKVMPQ